MSKLDAARRKRSEPHGPSEPSKPALTGLNENWKMRMPRAAALKRRERNIK